MTISRYKTKGTLSSARTLSVHGHFLQDNTFCTRTPAATRTFSTRECFLYKNTFCTRPPSTRKHFVQEHCLHFLYKKTLSKREHFLCKNTFYKRKLLAHEHIELLQEHFLSLTKKFFILLRLQHCVALMILTSFCVSE